MDVLVPHGRGQRKPGGSQSLPAPTVPIINEKAEENVRNEHLKFNSATPLQEGDTAFVRRLANKTCPQEPDERGAELAREARIWKVYVGESNKWDKELVEGWDKSMDVLLANYGLTEHVKLTSWAQAALFSAISTAFLIESSGALKQDPNDVSAAALLSISQALVFIANGTSSANAPTLPLSEQANPPDFVPSRNAIIVNVLWYMSLSLSLATSFLAMLAKDWCYSFSAHRTGHPRDQAHRRQQKWKLIEQWKMQELIVLLPTLMHVSLLLFSIGLCVYLWDLNHTIAIPVVCIAEAFLLFYIWSSVVASLVEDFPYTTIISRVMRSQFIRILYPTIAQIGRWVKLAWKYLFAVFYFPFVGIILALWVILMALSSIILTLTGSSFRLFFKIELGTGQLFDTFMKATIEPTEALILLPFRVMSGIDSRFVRATESLELTEDLISSLALSWLIQSCETPSAVDIALQAIAGASQRVPKEPLLSSGATEQIMRRIVSYGASDMEIFRNSLYIRSLEFLGLNQTKEPAKEKGRVTGDIEMLVWDLKSRHERKIAELIKDRSFVPSDNNLEAMRIGNSAAFQCLSIWRGETKDTGHTLHSIVKLLSRHFESTQDHHLHPAALQSLANAAALYASISTAPDLSPEIAGSCMRFCEQLIRQQSKNGTTESRRSCTYGPGVALILCVLLLRRPTEDFLDIAQPVSGHRARTLHAIRTLIDVSIEDTSFQENIFWICCAEIVTNRSEYGMDQCGNNWESLENGCSKRVPNFMRKWGTPVTHTGHDSRDQLSLARSSFLKATSQVYELVAASQSHALALPYLPESIYPIVAIIACGNTLDSSQSQVSSQLLSKFGFPRLSAALIDILKMPTSKRNETVLSAIGTAYTRRAHPHAQRHLAAIQLYLLLDLIHNPTCEDQLRLKANIEDILETNLQLQTKGFDHAKEDLEMFIIEGYRKEHRNDDPNTGTESRPLSIWNTIKAGLPAWRTRSDSESSFLRSDNQLNRLQNTLPSDIKGHHTMGKHQRVYTARVIRCILQRRGLEGNEDLESLIEADFKELLPCFQKLVPTLAPLPPSRTISQVSLIQTKDAAALQTAPTPSIDNTGHVSVEIHDPPGTIAVEDRNLD